MLVGAEIAYSKNPTADIPENQLLISHAHEQASTIRDVGQSRNLYEAFVFTRSQPAH